MKNKLLFPIFTFFVLSFASCVKDGDETVLINDPQDIPFITDFLPADLLALYGEENIYFGDVPPLVDLQFKSNHQYVATNLQPPYCPPIGSVTPVTHYHRLANQYLQIADYYSMSSEEQHCHFISPVYMTGHETAEHHLLFTAYYMEEPSTDGHPVHAVVLSGKFTPKGVENFMYGYKILRYNDSIVPTSVYPAESIFVFRDHDGLADTCTWYDNSLNVNSLSTIH